MSQVPTVSRPRRRLLPGGRSSLPLGALVKPGEDPRALLADSETKALNHARLLWRPRGVLRLLCYAGLVAAGIPIQAVLLRIDKQAATWLPVLFHRICCGLFGFDLVVHGVRADDRATLFISNHTSYLDISILGALIPASFVAKREIAGWPLFGWLAKLQRTVFIDRRPRNTAEHASEMERRIATGDNLILFPEGTSNDGNRVLPFKSALFTVAQLRDEADRPAQVQPVSLAYTHLDGLPLIRSLRPFYAWYGGMGLAPHLWDVVSLGHVQIDVIFHPPVTIEEFDSRKALARHCETRVADGVAAALSHREERIAALVDGNAAP